MKDTLMDRSIHDFLAKEPKPTEGLVWHYTSPEGLAGILQNNVLWATSAAFLNDTHEFTSGTRHLRRQLRKLSGNDPETNREIDIRVAEREIDPSKAFILSASRDGDSLTLWRNYGKHTVGYAVGLRPDVPLTPLELRKGDAHPTPPEGWEPEMFDTPDGPQLAFDPDRPEITPITHENKQWFEVVYGGEKRMEILRKEAWEFITAKSDTEKRQTIFLPWLSSLLRIKDAGFKDEREVRMGYTTAKPDWKFLAFRGTQWGLTPYIKLTAAADNYDAEDAAWGAAHHAVEAAKLPISHIRIGPTPYRKAAKKALRQLLDMNGYGDVKILSSKTPYRQ
ncbi:hypothetical protein [Arthrobacter sp. UNC362MFTsu5.1]|uniref:hypothetical protein n=1 Tax=Arthrobacter sp. UNC362MFTsu5.1 TaxID=1449044 RepID=UPI001E3378C7|nr:hypothetical protein [Arthrobacter sp. UNC362MFTsu5.1]